MEDIIVINDVNLAVKIRDALEKNGHRNSKFTFADYKKFTKEELETIESLKFENEHLKDISALKYCKNLRELSIISANAKEMQVNLSEEEVKANYALKQSQIQDFSSIEGLENLEFLTIKNVDNLEKLDVTKLKKLASLELTGNFNLEEIEGLDSALEL